MGTNSLYSIIAQSTLSIHFITLKFISKIFTEILNHQSNFEEEIIKKLQAAIQKLCEALSMATADATAKLLSLVSIC
jgi:hypothetical protein